MEAKGCGSLANKIYKERDPTHLANVAAGLSSDSDEEDEEYMVEKCDENETQISNHIEISNSGSKNNMKVSKLPKNTPVHPSHIVGSMAEYVRQPLRKKKFVQASMKSGSMGEYLKQPEQPRVHPLTNSETFEQATKLHDRAPGQASEKKTQDERQAEEHVVQPQKKHQLQRKFCSPGAMSAYRNIRKKQLGNLVPNCGTEKDNSANENQPNDTDACEATSELDL